MTARFGFCIGLLLCLTLAAIPARAGFIVQVGAFLNPANAKRLAAHYRDKTYDTAVHQVQRKDRLWHVVSVGDFPTFREAASTARFFRQTEGETAVVARLDQTGYAPPEEAAPDRTPGKVRREVPAPPKQTAAKTPPAAEPPPIFDSAPAAAEPAAPAEAKARPPQPPPVETGPAEMAGEVPAALPPPPQSHPRVEYERDPAALGPAEPAEERIIDLANAPVRYMVQIGAYFLYMDAKRTAQRFADHGAVIVDVYEGENLWHVVAIGSYDDREEAARAAERFMDATHVYAEVKAVADGRYAED